MSPLHKFVAVLSLAALGCCTDEFGSCTAKGEPKQTYIEKVLADEQQGIEMLQMTAKTKGVEHEGEAEDNLRTKVHHSAIACQTKVTEEMVLAAQKKWAEGIVAISAAYKNDENYTQVAVDHINTLYGYDMGTVLFKPTLATEMQFRSTFEGALSYFVGTNGFAKEDEGFAIKGWTAVRFENEGIILSGTTAMAMGNYFFDTTDDDEIKVEYSFGYFLDDKDNLRINLQHSSKPFDPKK